MNIQWFGQSCFRIEAKEGSVLIDPFNKEIGLRPPKIKDDIVLVTHHHPDHSSISSDSDGAFVIDSPGEYERKGIYVRGVASYHDNVQGARLGLNTIYVIKAEDVLICHLGDIGQEKLTDDQIQEIGDIDVLMIPVGGLSTIGAKQAVEIIPQIEPKIVIPMHYKIRDLKFEAESADKFIKEFGLTPEKVEKLKVAKKNLPAEEMKLVMYPL